MPQKEFSERLKELIREERTSIKATAERIGIERKSLILWLEGRFYPRYDGLVKVADYFKVSIDYLLGETEEIEVKELKGRDIEEIKRIFQERLSGYMKEKGMTEYRLSRDLKLGQSTVSRWLKKGSIPETAVLIRISKMMGESMDYLLGRVRE